MVQAETLAERTFDQVVEWLEHFESLEDPRQAGKVRYPLDEVLLLCLVAVLSGADGWVRSPCSASSISCAASCRSPTARRAHDQLGARLRRARRGEFQRCFVAWTDASLRARRGRGRHRRQDARRSFGPGGGKAPVHMISAWSRAGSVSCSAPARWPRNPTRSPRSPSC